ncbi:MAG: hypothetical protein OCD02_11295 [Spirochaetaceae bacterium]
MTEKELVLELHAYKEVINPDCDIYNPTLKEIAEFMNIWSDMQLYDGSITKEAQPIIDSMCILTPKEIKDELVSIRRGFIKLDR